VISSKLLLRLWLAEQTPEVTDAEFEALQVWFAETAWGDWHTDPNTPRATWPDELSELIEVLESKADILDSPGHAWQKCKANFLGVKRRQLAGTVEAGLADAAPSGDEVEPVGLTAPQAAVLLTLRHLGPERFWFIEKIRARMSEADQPQLSEGTIKPAVRMFVKLRLAERPASGRGVRLTLSGTRMAARLAED